VSEQTPLKIDWKAIRQKAGPYPQEAFQFVRDGLQHTVKAIFGDAAKASNAANQPDRHVSGSNCAWGCGTMRWSSTG